MLTDIPTHKPTCTTQYASVPPSSKGTNTFLMQLCKILSIQAIYHFQNTFSILVYVSLTCGFCT